MIQILVFLNFFIIKRLYHESNDAETIYWEDDDYISDNGDMSDDEENQYVPWGVDHFVCDSDTFSEDEDILYDPLIIQGELIIN